MLSLCPIFSARTFLSCSAVTEIIDKVALLKASLSIQPLKCESSAFGLDYGHRPALRIFIVPVAQRVLFMYLYSI